MDEKVKVEEFDQILKTLYPTVDFNLKGAIGAMREMAKTMYLYMKEREISLLSEKERHEEGYQRIIKEILLCNPISARKRQDDTLEPPWEVIARMRKKIKELEGGIEKHKLAKYYRHRVGVIDHWNEIIDNNDQELYKLVEKK